MAMKRREFLSRSIAGVGALALGPKAAIAEELIKQTPSYYDPFRQDVPLGKTGMKFSQLCMGTGMRGGGRASNHTRMGQEKFHALIRHGYDSTIFVCNE